MGLKPQTLEDVLAMCEIDQDWDAIIVSDGSGFPHGIEDGRAIGWGAVIIENGKMGRTVCSGAASCGTNNMAEIMAILHALMIYSHGGESGKIRRVHIITDSLYCANVGGENLSRVKAANLPLWIAIDAIKRRGVCLHWHHVRRNVVNLNRLVDAIAGGSRNWLESSSVVSDSLDRLGVRTVSDVNPGFDAVPGESSATL